MIFFVVVTGTPDGVARVAPRLRDALASTRIIDGELIERVAAGGTWAAAAIVERDPICEHRFATDGETFIVVNGPALSADGDQAHMAGNALRAYRSGGSAAVANEMR